MEKKQIGQWEVAFGPPKKIEMRLVEEIEKFLNEKWLPVLLETVRYPWWSIKARRIPSPLIRIDMSPLINEKVETAIYEIEVRPAGIGILLSLFPEKVKHLKEIFLEFKCKGFLQIESTIQDDELAAILLELPYYTDLSLIKKEPSVWIRTDRRDGKITELEEISLCPIQEDGNKSYLVKLNLASLLLPNDIEKIDWRAPFVIKPLIGSRMRGVCIYMPQKIPGVTTKTGILRRITEEKEKWIIQHFIPPAKEGKYYYIWRIFFGWKGEQKYSFLAGLWNARQTLRIHGASDAIFGPLRPTIP